MYKIIFIITSIIILTACSKSVEGVIEYRTNGPLIKANATEIQIVPFDDFKKYMSNTKSLIDENISDLEKKIKTEESSINYLQKNKKDFENLIFSDAGMFYSSNKTIERQFTIIKEVDELIKKYKFNIDDYRDQIKFLKEGRHGPAMFPKTLIDGAMITKTDGDGKFNFLIKDDRKYIILAQRLDLYWYIPVKSNDKFIRMDNQNAIVRVCNICSPGANWPE